MSTQKKCFLAGSVFCIGFLVLYILDGVPEANFHFTDLAWSLLVAGALLLFVSLYGYTYEDDLRRIEKHLGRQGITLIAFNKKLTDDFGQATVEYNSNIGTFDLKRIGGFWRVGQKNGSEFTDLTDMPNPNWITLGQNAPLRTQSTGV